MRALSIRQPWAWLIVNGLKDVENRVWRSNYRGPVLIHAASGRGTQAEWAFANYTVNRAAAVMQREIQLPDFLHIRRGGIVGIAEMTDCVEASVSPWFLGPFGFIMQHAKPLDFAPVAGSLGLFRVEERGGQWVRK